MVVAVHLQAKAGEYEWLTYKQVYDLVLKIGNAMRSLGYGPVSFWRFLLGFGKCSVSFGTYICWVLLNLQGEKCGIYGANCTEWIISMEVISSLYASLISLSVVWINASCLSAKCRYIKSLFGDVFVLLQACNAHGLYCVPLYDTLGKRHGLNAILVLKFYIYFILVHF